MDFQMSTEDNQTLPKKRRRLNRKRRLKASNESSGTMRSAVPILEDTTFRLERDDPILKKKPVVVRSLPILLMERQTGFWTKRIGDVTLWQNRMIQEQRQSNYIVVPRRFGQTAISWRPYAKLEFTFRQLQTPVSDVVIGFDASGDHIVALGGRFDGANGVQPADWQGHLPFALRFYALPSNSKDSFSRSKRPLDRCTPLMTVPLDFIPTQTRPSFLPAEIPTDVVLDSNVHLGLTCTRTRSLNEISALTLFPTPSARKKAIRTSVASIRIPGRLACWFERTNFLPSDEECGTGTSPRSFLWNLEYNIPAYLLLLHGNGSIRFVWVRLMGWAQVQGTPHNCPDRSTWAHNSWKTMSRSENPFLCTPTQLEPRWESKVFDCANGLICSETRGSHIDEVEVQVSFEISLSGAALADNLIRLCPQLFDFSNKERFDIRFIDQRSGFRAVEVLVAWPKVSGEGGLAAFVLIDMRSGDFTVLRWVQERPEVFDNESYLSSLLVRLRKNSSAKYGVLDTQDDSDWDFLCSPPKVENDTDEPYWMPKVDQHVVPPACYSPGNSIVLSNAPVVNETPAFRMKHSSAPLTLRYEAADFAL